MSVTWSGVEWGVVSFLGSVWGGLWMGFKEEGRGGQEWWWWWWWSRIEGGW